MSDLHFDPETYAELMRTDVPQYTTLQEKIVGATGRLAVARYLDLGSGTGETALRVLGRLPSAHLTGVDINPAMLEAARARLAGFTVTLQVADLVDPLPPGPFDLVTSALAIHHLEGPEKADLFGRIAAVLRPGGRFVLGDVVVPDDPSGVVTPLSEGYDKPSSVTDQLGWLRQAGFDVSVVWAQADLAVLACDRPT
jgi:tRNA (cmo5U34)-methyltransferase